MCGIFAYVNYHVRRSMLEILNTLINGLKSVEYRGYDSAGLCVDSCHTEGPLTCIRSVGNIEQLRSLVFSEGNAARLEVDATFDTHVGVAHTRWATHGVPSVANSHPQMSNGADFAVVHNGMLTNFMPVKEMLLKNGYHFDSDTDTEVVAVLIEYLFKQQPTLSFVELTTKLVGMLDGAYAILIKSSHFPGELIAGRKSLPLVVGIRQGKASSEDQKGENNNGCDHKNTILSDSCEIYFASDVNSFISYTQEVVFLEDDDVAHFRNGVLAFYTTDTTAEAGIAPIERKIQHIDHTPEGLCKDGYEHFMLKEIHEQPETVTRSMRGRIDFQLRQVHIEGIDATAVARLRTARRLMLIACGTSYHSCLAVHPIFEELLPDMVISVESASEFMDREPPIRNNDLCVFISQSGETADTMATLRHCKKGGAILVGLTNVPGSSVMRQTDYSMLLNAGIEVGVASTKAYTSQITVLVTFALLLSQDGGNSTDSATEGYKRLQQRRLEIIDGLSSLPAAIAQCLKKVESTMKVLSKEWKSSSPILVLGRGYDYASALEAALKIKEVSYIFTEGIHAGELKHGSIALVEENTRVIVFCAYNRYFERSKGTIQQVNARGGGLVVITTQKDVEIAKTARLCVEVPEVVDCLQGVVNILPMQLLAYYLAVERGNNVDCPRNLAKSVTVE